MATNDKRLEECSYNSVSRGIVQIGMIGTDEMTKFSVMVMVRANVSPPLRKLAIFPTHLEIRDFI